MISIDLSYHSQKDKKTNKILDSIFVKYQKDFNILITKAIKQKKNNLTLLLSNPISRNPFLSKMYYNFCIAIFVRQNISNYPKLKKIIFDSPALAKILKPFLKNKKIEIQIDKSLNYRLISFSFIKMTYNLTKIFFKKIYQLYTCKITNINKKKNIYEKIILIDTFVLPGFYNKDRYFSGLLQNINNYKKEKVFYSPVVAYTSIKNYYKVYKKLRNSKLKLILKEDFLKYYDVFSSVTEIFFSKFSKFEKINYKNIDFSELFNFDIINGTGDEMTIEGILNYKFVRRLKEKKVNINCVIDWWENQAIDKGLSKGIQTFYPKTKLIGYLGYYPRQFELQLLPLKIEYELKCIPNTIAVIGNKIKKKIGIYENKLKVITAPAFRFSYLWNLKKKNNKNKVNILVALPVIEQDISRILNSIPLSLYKNKRIKINIKTHPTMTKQALNKFLNKKNKIRYNISSGGIHKNFEKTDILISTSSIACLEALSLGISVINIKRQIGMDYHAIPSEIPKTFWKNCSNENEICETINYFIKNRSVQSKYRMKMAKIIRKNYFEPISKTKILKLVN